MENLKRKDPPILTNDEIIAATEEVESLTNFFNEDIATAKVTEMNIMCHNTILQLIQYVTPLINYN